MEDEAVLKGPPPDEKASDPEVGVPPSPSASKKHDAQEEDSLLERADLIKLLRTDVEKEEDVWGVKEIAVYYARFILPLLLYLVAVVVLFALLEGWGIVDSIYFGSVLMTTVGYGDLLPTSPTMATPPTASASATPVASRTLGRRRNKGGSPPQRKNIGGTPSGRKNTS